MSKNKAVKKRKVNKRKKRKIVALWLFLIITVALLCTLSLTVFFPVETITATGSNIYSAEEIVNASGINIGENLLRVSEKRVLSALQNKLPFIDSVKISKQLPGDAKLIVSDAKELYVFCIDGVYYSADDQRRVLKSYSEKPNDILYIECTAKNENGRVVCENEKAEEIIVKIANSIDNFSLKADYINLNDLYAVEMSFDSRFKVNFGEFIYFEEKLAHFLKMAEDESLNGKRGTVNLSEYTPDNPKAFFVKEEK